MNEGLTKEVLARLDALAAKLGTTADQLWTILVKQAGVELVICGLGAAISGTFFVLGTLSIRRGVKMPEGRDGLSDGALAYVVIGSISTIVGLFALLIALSAIPTLAMNPEYWALQQILKVLQ